MSIGSQLSIHSHEHVPIERRRYAEGIIIGGDQQLGRFLQIGAEQQRVASPEDAAHFAQKVERVCQRKVSDVRAEKKRDGAPLSDRLVPKMLQSGEVVGGVAGDPQSRVGSQKRIAA
jgi:hypothetical protein